jgi:hypothetical protein
MPAAAGAPAAAAAVLMTMGVEEPLMLPWKSSSVIIWPGTADDTVSCAVMGLLGAGAPADTACEVGCWEGQPVAVMSLSCCRRPSEVMLVARWPEVAPLVALRGVEGRDLVVMLVGMMGLGADDALVRLSLDWGAKVVMSKKLVYAGGTCT